MTDHGLPRTIPTHRLSDPQAVGTGCVVLLAAVSALVIAMGTVCAGAALAAGILLH
jgi:hypothetical protein